MAKAKGKEIMKVVAVVILSIGLLSALFVGINRIAFATATNGEETLPQITTPVTIPQRAEVENAETMPDISPQSTETQTEEAVAIFQSPTLTLLESPSQHYHTIPTYALSMEDAAEIGARYIWDVLSADIDGMYVQMTFTAHPSQPRTKWFGIVSASGDTTSPPDSLLSLFMLERLYLFTIDGITGERIDISNTNNVHRPTTPENFEAAMAYRRAVSESFTASRNALMEIGWFRLTLEEQIEFLGVSSETLNSYEQRAREFAERHFNLSSVVDVRLDDSYLRSPIVAFTSEIDESGSGADFRLASLRFIATDDTGREAVVVIPADTADWMRRDVEISTQHNDFIPGFNYDRPGGVG